MPLAVGAKLGAYEVLSLIGAGGMGEVYRARDPRLNREVAIKVLPSDRLGDESRRRRFVQEAQAASALNHPNIVTIHEIESVDGLDFIVMEYVRGKSLDALIPRQGMRLGEVLRIAIPVADALAAAHARGIVHRDLKPANLMVAADGAVKVLDFGLAKLTVDGTSQDEETVTVVAADLSTPGMIVGTAAYMSPEQAAGGTVDARSDVFSFGTVLYEMVTGMKAFSGTTMSETLSAVQRAQPRRPAELVTDLPADLETVIRRCLRKEPDRRFQHIIDAKIALLEIKEDSESAVPGARPTPRPRRRRLLAAVAIPIVALAAATAWLLRSRSPAELPPMRVVPLTSLRGGEMHPTFSPDGRQVAFAWDGGKEGAPLDIYVTMLGSPEPRRLTTPTGYHSYVPSWAPDGQHVAFLRATPQPRIRQIRLISPLGGSETRLNDFAANSFLAWSPDARYLAVGRDAGAPGGKPGIYLIPVQGGEPRAVTHPPPSGFDHSPAFSSNGRSLAYVSCKTAGPTLAGCAVVLATLDATLTPTGSSRRLTPEGAIGLRLAWSRDDRYVIYTRDSFSVGYLWRVAVDGTHEPERLEIAGLRSGDPATLAARDALVFVRGYGDSDIYGFHPTAQTSESLVASSFGDGQPAWSPDGRRIAFCSSRSGDSANEIWVSAADGSQLRQLTRGPGDWQCSPRWSPDGRAITFNSRASDGHWHVWTVDADGGTPRQMTAVAGDQNNPEWSRDGQWIYFTADEGAGRDVWRVAAAGGQPQQVTHGGSAWFAMESSDGRTLLYQTRRGDSPLVALPLAGGPPREVVACVKSGAFSEGPLGLHYLGCEPGDDWTVHLNDRGTGRDRVLGRLEKLDRSWPVFGLAVSPDGETILYTKRASQGSDLMLIENFR